MSQKQALTRHCISQHFDRRWSASGIVSCRCSLLTRHQVEGIFVCPKMGRMACHWSPWGKPSSSSGTLMRSRPQMLGLRDSAYLLGTQFSPQPIYQYHVICVCTCLYVTACSVSNRMLLVSSVTRPGGTAGLRTRVSL